MAEIVLFCSHFIFMIAAVILFRLSWVKRDKVIMIPWGVVFVLNFTMVILRTYDYLLS